MEDVYEPYLMQMGFLQRTPRGRGRHPAGPMSISASPRRPNSLGGQGTLL